jgi:hypothetical protein
MLFSVSLDFLNKLWLDFINSPNDLSPFEFSWRLIDTFLLILNTELCVKLCIFLKNKTFIVASEFSITIN